MSGVSAALGLSREKSALSSGQMFKHFKATYAAATCDVSVDDCEQEWRYHSGGPRTKDAVVFVGPACSTSAHFFRQLCALCPKGYHIVACQPPPFDNVEALCRSFERFLNAQSLARVHLVGCSLGGYIAAHFTSFFPSRVVSLVVCNSFVSTQAFVETMPLLATGGVAFSVMPAFALRAVIMQSLDQGALLPEVADAVDFVVEELDCVPREQLASRLAAHCAMHKVRGPLRIEAEQILVIESHDKIARPPRLKEELLQFFPGSKVGEMKHGGDFPYLSFPDEFNVFVEVHLKRNGYKLP